MRIRTLKPEWLEDERMAAAGSDARVLSIALILLADDYGRGRAGVDQLSARVFSTLAKPRETLAKALEGLRGWFVTLYEVRGQSYYQIVNWDRHQKVDKPGKPRVPPMSEALENIRETLAKVPGTLATDPDQDQDLRSRPPTSKESSASPPLARQAREVFVEWSRLCAPRARPDAKRIRTIEARLREGYTTEQLKLVPAGALKTPWNAGENPAGRRYLDVGLLFRSAEHVERFLAAAKPSSEGNGYRRSVQRDVIETRLRTARTFGRTDEATKLEAELAAMVEAVG